MNAMRYQALLLDIDGTLVGHSRKISEKVMDAIYQASQIIPVALVSSRRHMSVSDYAIQLGLGGLHISESGARVFDPSTGTSYWKCTMRKDDVFDIVKFIEYHGYHLSVIDNDRHVGTFDEISAWCVTSVSAVSLNPLQAKDLVQQFSNRPNIRSVAIPMQDDVQNLRLVDFTSVEASKGIAAHKWAALMGIAPEAMIGIGDSYNDLALFEACGLKVAMGNGAEELKLQADFIAPPVDKDGVALVIEKFILNR
jgi:HAD superfamily hydrolase (TIGR01484 family)